MWMMLTRWETDLRMIMARVHLAVLVGSLPTLAQSVDLPAAPTTRGQHQPWRWVLL